MSSFQKGIKIAAYILAILIVVSMCSAVYNLFMTFVPVNDKIVVKEYSKTYKHVEDLDIEITAASLNIEKGEEFKIEASNLPSKLKVKKDGNKVKIKMAKSFANIHIGEITITVPEKLDDFSLEAGAGSINISDIEADNADIKLGVGKSNFENVKFNDVEITGGAGKTTITKSELKNLNLEAGAGSLHVSAYLKGSSKINCGVGQVSITLLGEEDDYKIKAKKGLGSLNINGKDYGQEINYGDGKNKVTIEGGIGEINIRFK